MIIIPNTLQPLLSNSAVVIQKIFDFPHVIGFANA